MTGWRSNGFYYLTYCDLGVRVYVCVCVHSGLDICMVSVGAWTTVGCIFFLNASAPATVIAGGTVPPPSFSVHLTVPFLPI